MDENAKVVEEKFSNPYSERFSKRFWRIYSNYYDAKTHLTICKLIAHKYGSRMIWNSYVSFDYVAHMKCACLGVTKLFDKRPHNINVLKFLDYAVKYREAIMVDYPKCKFCDPKFVKKVKAELNTLENDLRIVKTYRDEQIAHEHAESPPFLLGIKWGVFERVFKILEEFFLDYGSTPNHFYVRPDEKDIPEIKEFFSARLNG